MLLEIKKNKKKFSFTLDTRINAASKSQMPFKLVSGMSKNNVTINRKILSDIAISDENNFKGSELASN